MKLLNKSLVTGQINNFFSYYGWPTVCVDEQDILYAVCSGHRFAHVCPFGKTYLYKSRNQGDTWSAPVIADDSYFDDRDAGILYMGNGKMLVTNFKHPVSVYQQHYKDCIREDAGNFGAEMLCLCNTLSEEDKKGGSFYCISKDYGESFGEKKRIPISCPHGPIQLNNGDVLYVGKEMYSYGAEQQDIIAAYRLDTATESFVKVGSCEKPVEYPWDKFHEPHAVQLDNGAILAVYRSQISPNSNNFTMHKTFSYDNGKTWTIPEETGICGSPPHLCKLSDGRVLLSYARRMPPFGIYAVMLQPDGTFGTDEILIDSAKDSDIGYPATVQLSDKSLVTVFYKREISEKYTSIVSVHWSL